MAGAWNSLYSNKMDNDMRNLVGLLFIVIISFSCSQKVKHENFFLTKLGNDTLAIERFQVRENTLKADVVLRSPRTSLRRYEMAWDEDQRITSMTVTDFTESNSFMAENGRVIQKATGMGDSLNLIYYTSNGDRTQKVANRPNLIPFVDMVHWPYELAFLRAAKSTRDSIDQYMNTGRRNSNFIIHRLDDTSFTIRHPSRGVMAVTIASDGELMSLDAAETTRKLKVERGFDLEFDALAATYAERDKVSSPFGTLSPAVTNDYHFANADFEVSYGSPSKRGRDIFGGIVPYNKRWRTGANRATHFKTSRSLMIQGQRLPAGEYTLFTIPEPDGGILIVNKQTGQNGQSYDESRDLMRVQMKRTDNNSRVESFTITVDKTPNGGKLNLIWDRTIYSVDFKIL